MTAMKHSLARRLASALSPRGARGRLVVFSYHQVLEQQDPYRRGEPNLAEFSADVDTIASVFTVLPLPDAVDALAAGSLPARAACITFDDGYRNNLTLAAPVLERKGVPATFFIAGDAVDRGIMWNDLIIETIGRRGSGATLESLGDITVAEADKGDPCRYLESVIGQVKYRPLAERWNAASRFYVDNVGGEFPRLMMEPGEVAELARRGFDVGGHTIHHPILQELDATESRAEIAGCRAWLKTVTGREARTFAYPNGVPGRDFGPEHEAMVADAGFEVAVSTEWAVARPSANRYRIPRIGPWWRQGKTLLSGLARSYARSYIR